MNPTSYIQLVLGQGYLFEDPKYTPVVMVTDNKGERKEIPVKYDVGRKNVVYNLPTLNNDKIYTLSFENMPKDRNINVDKNVTTQSKEVLTASSDAGSSATISTKSATGLIEEVQGKVLLAYPFRTSFYETLQAKLASNKVEGGYFNRIGDHGQALGAKIFQPREPFDASELNADQNLISFEVNFKSHAWFTDRIKGSLYKDYPVLNHFKVDRDTSILGLIPTRDVTFTQTLPTENLSTEQIDAGVIGAVKSYYTLTGNFHGTMGKDYDHIGAQVANLYSKGIPVGIYTGLITYAYPGINMDNGFSYPVEVYYHFPWENAKRKVGVINVVLD